MPAPFEAPASPSRQRSPAPTRFTPRTPMAALAQPSPSPFTRQSKQTRIFRNVRTETGDMSHAVDGLRSGIRTERYDSNLLGSFVFAETLQAIAQAPLQRRGRVGIESYEIPQRLAAVPAQPGQCGSVRVGMPRHIFTNCPIRMFRKLVQRLGIGSRLLADQPQQIKILFRSLLDKFLQHFRLRIRA